MSTIENHPYLRSNGSLFKILIQMRPLSTDGATVFESGCILRGIHKRDAKLLQDKTGQKEILHDLNCYSRDTILVLVQE